MEYVFGQTFICDDMNLAEKITFDKEVKKENCNFKR